MTEAERSSVAVSAEGLSRTLLKRYAGRGLGIELDVSPEHWVQCRREDLDQMLGNLLDNACKWAKSRVAIASEQKDNAVVITVDDDGPGLDPSMSECLAIVSDLAGLYGGSISLGKSDRGGLRAQLQLPGYDESRRSVRQGR